MNIVNIVNIVMMCAQGWLLAAVVLGLLVAQVIHRADQQAGTDD